MEEPLPIETNKDTEVNKTFLRYVPLISKLHFPLVQFYAEGSQIILLQDQDGY